MKTNIQNIPSKWKQVSLEQCVEIDRESLSEHTSPNLEFFYIDLSSVTSNKIKFPTEKLTFKNAPSRARRIIHKKDILFATVRPYLQGFALIDFEASNYIASTGFAVLTEKKDYDIRYVYQYLFFEHFQKQIQTLLLGSSFPALNNKDIKHLRLLIPHNIYEQRKIVEVLETWDKAIGLTKQLIEQKELQKKYLMQQLLTGRTRLKGFTCEWKLLPLSEILKERKEYQAKNQNLPHLSLTKEGVLPKTDRYNRDFLVKDEDKLYKITHENDICYNPANLKFGVICRNQYGSGIFSPIYVTYEVTKYSSGFVGYLLTLPSSIAQARRFEEGTVYERMAVSSEDFLKVKLPFPTCEEESKQISIVIRKAEEEIALLRQKLAKLEEQKKGLIQILLTGKVRLI